MGMLTYFHWYKGAYDPAKFHFTYYGFQWVSPLPEPFMSLFLISLLVASIFITIGRYYRWSTTYFAIGFIYMFLVEKGHYLNHGYLFCWLSVLMIFLPAQFAYSGDVLKKIKRQYTHYPFWGLFLLRFFMGVVYFYGGIAKINEDWFQAQPLKIWLKGKREMFLVGGILEQEWLAWFMSYGGLALDLFIVPMLLFRRTRWWALGAAIFFHLTNTIIFQIGIFPWLSICMTLLFFAPDFPEKVGAYLQKRFPKFQQLPIWWQGLLNKNNVEIINRSTHIFTPFQKKLIAGSIILLCLLHLSVPFRHHYFKGNVAWTEEGHRYSWRMMLRGKRGGGQFKVKNLSTNELKVVRPKDYLSDRQYRKVYTHPDMILQFAHHIRDEYQEKWQTDSVAVYAKIRCKLNHRHYQNYTVDTIDLAREEWSFLKESEWIVPLEEKKLKLK